MLDESAEARKSNVSIPAAENADLQRNADNIDEPQIKSADSRRIETVKAKRAADAAQELAEAVSKFFPNSQPVSMTEVETRAAAWHKANKFPSESDKEFLIEPNPAVSDIALPPPPLPVET